MQQCEVLEGLETFERVSRSETEKATFQGQVRTFISGSSALKRSNGGEDVKRKKDSIRTLEGAPRPKSSLELFYGFLQTLSNESLAFTEEEN